MTEEPTLVKVIIRRGRTKETTDELFALFPAEPNSYDGALCVCWDEQGGHCGAEYYGCIARSKPATKEQTARVVTALRRIDYSPQVLCRAARAHHEQRRQAAR